MNVPGAVFKQHLPAAGQQPVTVHVEPERGTADTVKQPAAAEEASSIHQEQYVCVCPFLESALPETPEGAAYVFASCLAVVGLTSTVRIIFCHAAGSIEKQQRPAHAAYTICC